jgi:hypothetical protein
MWREPFESAELHWQYSSASLLSSTLAPLIINLLYLEPRFDYNLAHKTNKALLQSIHACSSLSILCAAQQISKIRYKTIYFHQILKNGAYYPAMESENEADWSMDRVRRKSQTGWRQVTSRENSREDSPSSGILSRKEANFPLKRIAIISMFVSHTCNPIKGALTNDTGLIRLPLGTSHANCTTIERSRRYHTLYQRTLAHARERLAVCNFNG